MFANIHVNNAFLRPTGVCLSIFQRVLSSVKFGNPQMPDKLYKSITLEVKSFEPAVMKSYEKFIKTAAEHLDVNVESVVRKPRPNIHRVTLLKSIFVHRKHLTQYEVRTYYSWINLKHLTGSTADTFLEYIERMLPEGVALKVTKVALEPLPEHLNSENVKEVMKMKV